MEIPKSRKQNNEPCVICGARDPEIKYRKFIKLTLLPCGHIYHEYCLQHHDYKCLYCLKYIKNQINISVESINRLTCEKDFPIEDDPEDELQMAFNLQAEIEFNTAL